MDRDRGDGYSREANTRLSCTVFWVRSGDSRFIDPNRPAHAHRPTDHYYTLQPLAHLLLHNLPDYRVDLA